MGPENHSLDTCPQTKRLEKIELTMEGTIKELVEINLKLIELKTILEGKINIYDSHVKDGEAWRTHIMSWVYEQWHLYTLSN